jgi:hypothetical protein
LSAATNHSLDYGHEGIERTLTALRERNLVFAGLGENLFAARKPGYLETPAGRIALVSACTSVTPGSEAGEQTAALKGRPGMNPLRVDRIYRLTPDRIEDLKRVSEAAGIEAIKRSWLDRGLYYNHDWANLDYFHFGDMKFKAVSDETDQGVNYELNEADLIALTDWVTEARTNADWVVATIHSHQGVGGHQNTSETPAFLIEAAHRCVDAGADAVIGTGSHVLRGIEVYEGQPVFYSLGNFIVQNETITRLPLESYTRYGLEDPTKVSAVFNARLYDEDGTPKGDLANLAFWETVIPVCVFGNRGNVDRIELYPCTLQPEQPRPQRGIPVLATDDAASSILNKVTSLSEAFGTEITVENGVGTVNLESQ